MFQKTWKNKKIKLTSGLSRRIFKIAAQGFMQAPIRPVKKRRKPLLASNFNRPPNYFNWLIKKLFITALCGLAFFLILIAGLFFWYAQDLPKVAQIKSGQMVIPESTKIYDRSGQYVLYTIYGEENRTYLAFSDIPNYVKWATVATEDQRFYERKLSVDLKGLARALFGAIKEKGLTGPGGSTITQQLVKNLILTREKTLSRKIKEIILSYRIEKSFTRDEILELYLNQIPYGSNAYGIESASQTFFAKTAKDLSLAESAVIAALPKATTYYSPYGQHQDELFERQKIILKLMLNQGYIKEEEYSAAKAEEITFKPNKINILAPHFVVYVREILAKKYGENELDQAGLKVITSLDYNLQKIAEKAISEGAKANDGKGADNAALAAINPKTGEILALVGSRDYNDEKHQGNFNAATQGLRQPGSSFKPIVYTALFEKGYTSNTILYDTLTDFDPGPGEEHKYLPYDFDKKERGPVTIRQALAGSLNIPAVKALYLAGIDNVFAKAEKIGYTTLGNSNKTGLSLALGGGNVKLLEHTAAFAVLAAEGIKHQLTPILKVIDNKGEILEEWQDGPGVPVFKREAVLMTTDILQDNAARVYIFGENNKLVLPNRPAAVKTGTTNDYIDAWAVGYTPSLAAGVWAGRNDNKPMKQGSAEGSQIAAPIWNKFMQAALAGQPAEIFPKPEIPKTGKSIIDGELTVDKVVKIDKISGKLATELTPQELIEEKKFLEYHTILYYIDKNNPLGPAPADPALDPQFANWEQGIAGWLKKQNITVNIAPTEYDNVHTTANQPIIEILSPKTDETAGSDDLLVRLYLKSAPGRQIKSVKYFLDNNLILNIETPPYSRNISLKEIADGSHVLKFTAVDDVLNYQEQSVNIQVQKKDGTIAEPANSLINNQTANVIILNPNNNDNIARLAFPYTIQAQISALEQISRINFYYNDQQDNPIFIGSVKSPIANSVSVLWEDIPNPGGYKFYAVFLLKSGNSGRTEIFVNVQ